MTVYSDAHWHTVTCSECRRSIDLRDGSHLRFGEFWYHRACIPSCRACGRGVRPEDETAWTYNVHVVSTPYGYAQRPTSFLCPVCLDGALRDEVPCLD